MTYEEILNEHPYIEKEDIQACLKTELNCFFLQKYKSLYTENRKAVLVFV